MATERSEFADRRPIEHSIVAAKDGSFSALGQLLDHYRDYLLKIANDELASDLVVKAAPSDLVQETFLQAARDFPKFQGGTEEELRAWLRRILLRNLQDTAKCWLGTQKRAGLEASLDDSQTLRLLPNELTAPGPSPSTLFRTDEDRRRVRRALARLPEEYRQAIELRTFRGLTFQEAGAAMNRSGEAVRKLWSRAIERLGEELLGEQRHDRSAD